MSNSLRPEIITPIHSYTFRIAVAATVIGVFSAAVALSGRAASHVPPPPPAPHAPEVLARGDELQLVFHGADATYMKLASVGDALPLHGPLRLYDRGEADRWQTLSIGEVADQDVPPAYRAWRGKTVVVDGRCTAKVTGFAVVGRLTGTPDYAGVEGSAWTAEAVLEHGEPMLAAKLDGCEDGMLARDATRSPIVPMIGVRDDALATRARTKLLASAPAEVAQLEWERNDGAGDWAAHAAFHTIVARHPTTNVTWVSVHGIIDEGCGGTNINIWGLYRVVNGELVAAQQRDLGDMRAIDKLIDLEGDGEPELVGSPRAEDAPVSPDIIVSRANGDEVARLVLPFYGCAC